MTLYLDAIWLLNFLIDLMILRLTGYLRKKKNSGIRLLLGSVFASLIVFVVVFFPNSILLYPLGKIIFSIFIIVIAFRHKSWIELLKTWLSFYFVSFAIGGILLGVHFIMQQSIQFENGSLLTITTGYGTPISWLFVTIGFPLCWYFTKQTMDKQALVNYQEDQLFDCELIILNKIIPLLGYLDSANHLIDPISKNPVIIIDPIIIKQIFSEDVYQKLEEMSHTLDITTLDQPLEKFIRLIPYQDVSNKAGVLIALKPDQFTFSYQNQIIQSKHVLIGLRFSPLATEKEYNCLLNPQLFNLAQIN